MLFLMIRTKRYSISAGDPAKDSRTGRGAEIFYCVLHIDRFSNRVLVSVFSERKNAESFRNQSPYKLHIEPEEVIGYDGEDTLWCSNEWGPGDVLSFMNLHTSYDEAVLASNGNGRPSPMRVGDARRFYSS
jgi:hypothetical protein